MANLDRIGLDPNLYGESHYNSRGGGPPRVPSTRSQGPRGGNMSRAFSTSLESDATSNAGYTLSGGYDRQQQQEPETVSRELTQGKVSS
jgi:hypothetical protein